MKAVNAPKIEGLDLPEDVGKVVDRQANIVLVIRDSNVFPEADNLCVSNVGSVQEGEKEKQC